MWKSKKKEKTLYGLYSVYAWSNNPKKPPRFGSKWDSDCSCRRKKYLWYASIILWNDGTVRISDPVLMTNAEMEENEALDK